MTSFACLVLVLSGGFPLSGARQAPVFRTGVDVVIKVPKPVILAESGAVEPRHSGPFKLYAADRDGTLLHDILFAPFFAGAAGPGQIWHWDAYVAKNDLWWHFGRFRDVVKGIDPAEEFYTPDGRPVPIVNHGRVIRELL